MLFSVEQAFVGRDEKRAPLKTIAWEATPEAATRRTQSLTFVSQSRNNSKRKYKKAWCSCTVAVMSNLNLSFFVVFDDVAIITA